MSRKEGPRRGGEDVNGCQANQISVTDRLKNQGIRRGFIRQGQGPKQPNKPQ